MKSILFTLFVLLNFFAYSQQQTPERLRHLMQTYPSSLNEIAYGVDMKAGNYAQAGDAKIYYEVCGKERLIGATELYLVCGRPQEAMQRV